MIACYDLALNPPTFDVVTFLVQIAAARNKAETVQINIAPGPNEGFRADELWPASANARCHLRDNIVVPMCEMLPGATLGDGTRAGIGAAEYSIRFHHFVNSLSRGIRPLRPRPTLPNDPTLVTITLREAEHWSPRNSNVSEWRTAARDIRQMGYRVVFVRDTMQAETPLEDFEIAPAASRDLHQRGALYRSARCNLFVNNGPAWFALACDAPVLILKPNCEQLAACYDRAYLNQCGINSAGIPNSPDYQKIVWQEDRRNEIVAAFREFIRCV